MFFGIGNNSALITKFVHQFWASSLITCLAGWLKLEVLMSSCGSSYFLILV